MTDRFLELCAREFAHHVQLLFDDAHADATKNVAAQNAKYLVLKTPHIGFLYSACDHALVPKLKELVCAALAHRQHFRRTKPEWAPELPLSFDACEKLQTSCSTRMRRLGAYGYSLMVAQWDPMHPAFAEWLAAGRREPDDAALEEFERFSHRMDAGILRQGQIA